MKRMNPMTKEQFMLEMERIGAMDWSITRTAISQAMLCMRYIESLEAENAQLQADNRSLVEQMNQMALKQNQED
jgi:hypothetical protein